MRRCAQARRALRLRLPISTACRRAPGQSRHASDNREESARAAAALDACRARRARRRRVRRRSRRLRHGGGGLRGDRDRAGQLGARSMSPSCPASPPCWRWRRGSARRSAMISAPCRCPTISSPGTLIERRLDAAADAGFVIALYNPVSRARPWQLGKAFDRLRRHLPDVDAGRSSAAPSAAPTSDQTSLTLGASRRGAGRHGDAGHRRFARNTRHRARRGAAAGLYAARRRRRSSRMIEPRHRRIDRLDGAAAGGIAAGAP